jgi:DNA-binding NarL/FixJ family response regulator
LEFYANYFGMIRVTIFEDNALINEGIRMMVESQTDMLMAGAFRDARGVLNKIKKTKPNVVLMDINMPDVNGIEAVTEIKREFPEILVMMQTIFEDDDKVFAAICGGASGYMLKGTSPDKMLDAIREMTRGGSPMSPNIARKVLHIFHDQFRSVKEEFITLTPKEKEVLQYLVDGFSYKMIADKMKVTFHTVNDHIKNIYNKLHVNSAPEAVSKALKNKLL